MFVALSSWQYQQGYLEISSVEKPGGLLFMGSLIAEALVAASRWSNESLHCGYSKPQRHLELIILELIPMIPMLSAHMFACRSTNILLLKPTNTTVHFRDSAKQLLVKRRCADKIRHDIWPCCIGQTPELPDGLVPSCAEACNTLRVQLPGLRTKQMAALWHKNSWRHISVYMFEVTLFAFWVISSLSVRSYVTMLPRCFLLGIEQ